MTMVITDEIEKCELRPAPATEADRWVRTVSPTQAQEPPQLAAWGATTSTARHIWPWLETIHPGAVAIYST